MSTPAIVAKFKAMYMTLNKDNLQLLQDVYSDDVVFIDALHEIKGLPALETYFAGMYENLSSSEVEVTDLQCGDGVAYLSWVMRYAHPKLAGGKVIALEGATQIKFDDKVTYHRDYADMGQMLYEHIPVLGSVIKLVKRRAVS